MKLLLTLALLVGTVASLFSDNEKRGYTKPDIDLDKKEASILASVIRRKFEENRRKDEKREELAEKRKLKGLIRRVVGGVEVEDGIWPWLVSIKADIPTKKFMGFTISSIDSYCGGSLVNKRWVLSAAHCFDLAEFVPDEYVDEATNPKNYVARLGDKDLEASWWDKLVGFVGDVLDKEEWRLKDWAIKGEKLFIFPQYDTEYKDDYDIALLKLSEEVPAQPDFIEEIQAVHLAKNKNFNWENHTCAFKGWGCNEEGGPVSSTAFEIELPITDHKECEEYYDMDLTDRLCAGYNQAGMGTCPGDSGGPLMCKSGYRWYQVGIASFVSSEDLSQHPAGFTEVSSYYDWIQNIIRNH